MIFKNKIWFRSHISACRSPEHTPDVIIYLSIKLYIHITIYIKINGSLFVPYAFLYRSTNFHEIWCFGDICDMRAKKCKPAKKKTENEKLQFVCFRCMTAYAWFIMWVRHDFYTSPVLYNLAAVSVFSFYECARLTESNWIKYKQRRFSSCVT